MAVSLTAVRRLVVGRQGFAGRFRRGDEADVEATIRRLTAVQLDSISAVDRAHRLTLGARIGAYPRDTVARPARRGADLRVLGARGVAAADRALAPLPHRHGRRRPLGLPRPCAARARRPRRARAGPHPRGRAARLARLRGPGRRRHVELEAGEDGARGALGPRPAGDRRPAELPAPLRPRRARDPRPRARRTDAVGGRDAARARTARGRRPRRADRGRDPRALAPEGRAGAPAAAPRCARRGGPAARGRGRRRRRAVLRPAGRGARRRAGAADARLPVRQPRLGPAAARARSSASST